MATVNTIRTRILNKYDVLSNYTDFTPLKGEICIAIVGEEVTTNKGLNGDITKKPIVSIKVGDGNTTFENLPWIQAIAGDVSTFIKGIVDENKFNELVNAIITNAKLATSADLNALTVRMSSAEEKVTALESSVNTGSNSLSNLRAAINAVVTNGADTKESDTIKGTKLYAEDVANTAKTEAISSAASAADAKYELIGVAETKVKALAGEGNTATVKGNADSITGINVTVGIETLTTTAQTLKGAINELDAEIGEESIRDKTLTKAIADLQASVGDSSEGLGTQVSTLNTKVGNLEAAIADEGALGSRVVTLENEMNSLEETTDAHSTSLATLIGSTEGDNTRSIRDIAALVISEALVGGGEDFDTLQEIAEWIKDHPADAAAMNEAISAIKTNLGWTGETAPATVDSRIATAISNLETKINIDNYATTAQLTTAVDRVTALESKVDTGDQNVSTYVEAAKQAAISAAATDAKTKADAAQAAAEATAAADATSKANAAQTAVEAKVTALAGEGNTATVKENAEAIASLQARTAGALTHSGTASLMVSNVERDENGTFTVTHRAIENADFSQTDVFVFYCGGAKGYDMTSITIENIQAEMTLDEGSLDNVVLG